MSEVTSSDLLSLANNIRGDNDGFFGSGSSSFWVILILFFLMGGGGWNNNNNNSLKSDLYEGLNSQNTFSEFRSMQNEITRGFSDVNQNLCNGFGGVQLGLANVNQNLGAGFSGVQAAIADSNYRMQDCCCGIKNAIRDDGEKTRILIQQNEIQKLRDELQDAKSENLATGLVTAQGIQTQNLENFMRDLFKNNIWNGCNC